MLAASLAAALVATSASPAHAQYFGRNKVQYEPFDFHVLRTGHFDIHFYPADSEVAVDAARMAERWHERLAGVLDHELKRRNPLVLYADHTDFQQTNTIGDRIDESTGGVTESLLNRVILPITSQYAETDHVLGHELVHAFQYEIAGVSRGSGGRGLAAMPQWFVDGMAEYLSIGRHDPHTAMWMRDAVLHDDIPTLSKLSRDPRYFPYRFGHAFFAFVGGQWGDAIVGSLYRAALDRGLDGAIQHVFELSPDSLSELWAHALREAYAPALEDRTPPGAVGRRVLARGMGAGDMILAPAASPDGRHLAFLSERDFSVDLFLADALTGEVVRKLASASASSHLDAISFMGSAGAWAPDGGRFAYVALANGDAEIHILDVESGNVIRRVNPPGIGAIATPAWSPDGRRIAFSGTARGVTDLYLLDVESGTLRRMTNDRFGELQPTWSPDGRTIAFVTDRGPGADFDRLAYAPPGIALLDVASGVVRALPLFDTGKHHSPQFSPDGHDLYFVADRGEVSDIYRHALGSGETFQVTRIATGVSGLTSLSPALTVAREVGTLFFSVFQERHHAIYALEPDQARGEPVARGSDNGHVAATSRIGWLPPAERPSHVDRYLADPDTGLVEPDEFERNDYRGRPRLAYFGPPSFGLGIGPYGVAIYGNMAAYFTDILGNHGVGFQAMANGGVKDLGGVLMYENRERRWNWGAGVGRTPYRMDFAIYRDTLVETGGRPVLARGIDVFTLRLRYDQAMLTSQYPFSTSRRFEVGAGLLRIGYDYEVERSTLSGGRLLSRDRLDLPAPEPLSLAQTMVALVGDYTTHGLTSPLAGGRHRFELQPTFGSLRYVTALADYRRYYRARPFTFAVRGMHFGRYGPDEDRPELGTLFLGNEQLVRGYAQDSFRGGECTTADSGPTGCAEFDRLIGSRFAVANLELRLPLTGPERFGLIPIGFLPTEIGAFIDGGVAWSAGDGASLHFARRSAERVPVFSAGASARVNLLGFAVLGAYYAVPFQRPGASPHFGFVLAPGW